MQTHSFTLTYADADGVGQESGVSFQARSINSAFRKVVEWATKPGDLPAGWELINVRWDSSL